MTGRKSEMTSGQRSRAKFPLIKVLARLLLVVTVLSLSTGGVFLYQEHNRTIRQLQDQLYQINRQSSEAKSKYDGLLDAYTQLQQEHQNLEDQYNALKNNLDTSQVESTQLSSSINRLKTDYQGLNSQFSSLQSSSVSAPYVSISGRNIYVAFRKLDKSLVQWVIPFSNLETEMKRADQTRTGLFGLGMPTIILKEGGGKELLVADFRAFMDTDTFRRVMTSMYEQSASDDAFIQEAWHIVGQFIQYQREKDEVPRFPMETLVGGAGDCEDMAILFASLIESAPVDWKVSFVYLNSKSPLDTLSTSDHVIVYIDTGVKKHYIETTSLSTMEPYPNGVAGWYLPVE